MERDNEIVFEDLHGVQEDSPVEVDLDAEANDEGIYRAPADDAADGDASDDDADDRLARDDDDDDSSARGDDDDDASSDSEDDAYSKKVKARIERERRQTKKAREEASYWREQAEKLAQSTSKAERDNLTKRVEQADAEINSTQDLLEKAIEEGNTKDQVKLTSKLTDLKAEKIQAQVRLDDLPADGKVPPFDGKVTSPTEKPVSLAEKWVESRSDWYGARGFERYTRLANRLDKEVYNDGYDPKTPEYFKELDRRMKEKAPDLYDDLSADDKSSRNDRSDRKRKRSPVGSVDSGGSNARRSGNRRGKVELTDADFDNMRRFNLDPNDPAVLKEYARNKAEGAKR